MVEHTKEEKKLFEKIISVYPLSTSEISLILQSNQNPISNEEKEKIKQVATNVNFFIYNAIKNTKINDNQAKQLLEKYEKQINEVKEIIKNQVITIGKVAIGKLKRRYKHTEWHEPFLLEYLTLIRSLLISPKPLHKLILILSGGLISPMAFAKTITNTHTNLINIFHRYYQLSIHNLKEKLQKNPIEFKQTIKYYLKKYNILILPFRLEGEPLLHKNGVVLYLFKVPDLLKNYSVDVKYHYAFFHPIELSKSIKSIHDLPLYQTLVNVYVLTFLKYIEQMKVNFEFEYIINEDEIKDMLIRVIHDFNIINFENIPYFEEIAPIDWIKKVKEEILKSLPKEQQKKEETMLKTFQKFTHNLNKERKSQAELDINEVYNKVTSSIKKNTHEDMQNTKGSVKNG